MPYRDGTGPTGLGPMTGRAAGFCVESEAPGYDGLGRGRGLGGGRARGGNAGRGWRNRFNATGLPGRMRFGLGAPPAVQESQEAEREALTRRAHALEAQLEGIRSQLGEMNPATETEPE